MLVEFPKFFVVSTLGGRTVPRIDTEPEREEPLEETMGISNRENSVMRAKNIIKSVMVASLVFIQSHRTFLILTIVIFALKELFNRFPRKKIRSR